MLDKFKEEIAVMQICLNEYIIAHHFSYLYERTLFMFIDYMEFGELTRFINHYYKAIPENIIAYITKSILLGLKSIHQRRQLHRDLKSENILISSKGDIKISDFGFALQLTKDKLSCQDIVGTPAWMAP